MNLRTYSSLSARLVREGLEHRGDMEGVQARQRANAKLSDVVETGDPAGGIERPGRVRTPAVSAGLLKPRSREGGGNPTVLRVIDCGMPSARSRHEGRPRVPALGRPQLIVIAGGLSAPGDIRREAHAASAPS